MFYQLTVLCWAVSAVLSAPTDVVPLEKQQPTVIPIISQSDELEPNGTYKFSYETGNGIKREEISFDKIVPKAQGRSDGSNEGGESGESDEIHVQQGSYSYTAPDGTVITVRYIADENGFQAFGDHLPRAPALIQPSSSSAEKSGRALKNLDSAKTPSVPAPVTKPESAPVPAEPVPEVAQSAPDTQPEPSEPVPVSPAAVVDSSTSDASESSDVAAVSEQSAPVDVAEQGSTIPASEPTTEATEQSSIAGLADQSTTAAGEQATAAADDQSTAAAEQSTAAVDQSTTALEQTTSAAEQTTSAAEQTTSAAEQSAPVAEQSTPTAAEESSTVPADQPVPKENLGETSTASIEQSSSAVGLDESVTAANIDQSATNAIVEQNPSAGADGQSNQPTAAAEESLASTESASESIDIASTTVSV